MHGVTGTQVLWSFLCHVAFFFLAADFTQKIQTKIACGKMDGPKIFPSKFPFFYFVVPCQKKILLGSRVSERLQNDRYEEQKKKEEAEKRRKEEEEHTEEEKEKEKENEKEDKRKKTNKNNNKQLQRQK